MRFSYVTNPVFLAYSLRKKVVSIIIHIILGSSGEIADKFNLRTDHQQLSGIRDGGRAPAMVAASHRNFWQAHLPDQLATGPEFLIFRQSAINYGNDKL
jgi:hypothetical protein